MVTGTRFLQHIWWAIWFGLFLTSTVLWIVSPEYFDFILGVFILSKIIFCILIYVNRKPIKDFLRTSFFKNFTSNIITIFLVLSIMAMINYLAFKNNLHVDITKQQVHTLSDQSKKVLAQVKSPLEMILFARRNNWDRYLNLLNLYKYENKNIQIKVIDIDTNPSLVQLNNVKDEGTIVIEYQGKKVSVVAQDELQVTNMLIKLMRSATIVVYYTVGHGELESSQQDQNGASYLFAKIQSTNYILKPLELIKTSDVPQDANLVMILGPQEGFLDLEIANIERYLKRGGNLLLTLAPEFNGVKMQNLYQLLEKFGLKFLNSIVLDRLAAVQGTQATVPIITDFSPHHSITKNFSGKILFPLSAALIPVKTEGVDYRPLLKTNPFPSSWAEVSFDEVKSGKAVYDDKDKQGPLDVAATLENQKTLSRILVTTSSSFILNGYQSQSSNFNFFLNMLAWGVDDEGIISLNRPSLSNERIILTASQITLIFFLAIGFIPFILFALAIFFYRSRLKK